MSLYGFCPFCGADGVSRERRPNGDDRCSRGHQYPSSSAFCVHKQNALHCAICKTDYAQAADVKKMSEATPDQLIKTGKKAKCVTCDVLAGTLQRVSAQNNAARDVLKQIGAWLKPAKGAEEKAFKKLIATTLKAEE